MSIVAATWIEERRATARRPITPEELPYMEALGSEIWNLRYEAELTRAVLAADAEISPSTLEYIELAVRRTRRSTLTRIAAALVYWRPEFGPADELTERLVGLAGPALAPESAYARTEKRRLRRVARKERERQQAEEFDRRVEEEARWLAELMAAPVLERKAAALEAKMRQELEVRTLAMQIRFGKRQNRLLDKADDLQEREWALRTRERALEGKGIPNASDRPEEEETPAELPARSPSRPPGKGTPMRFSRDRNGRVVLVAADDPTG